jgi:branched-chain amino acid transport system substrate-binding protein
MHRMIGALRAVLSFVMMSAISVGIAAAQQQSTNAQNQGVTDNEILIGALGALTGATAFMGGPGRDGIQLAVENINAAGGINGRKIRLAFEHAFTPAESVAAAKKLVEQDKVFALILASGSTGAAAAADYVREVGVPTYNIFGTTSIIREPFAKNVFHGQVTDGIAQAKMVVSRVSSVAKPSQKIGILAGTYAFPQSTLKVLVPEMKAAGFDVVVEQFDQGSRDFTAQLISFVRQRVAAIVILGNYAEAGFAIKQGAEKGLSDVTWVLDGSAVNDAMIPIIGKENTKNVIGFSNFPYFHAQKDEPIAKFRDAWVKRYGTPPAGRPNMYDTVSYGDMYVLAEAIKSAGKDITWSSLIEAWSKLKDAKPSNLGGIDVIYPESFTETDHQGNKLMGKAVIKDGIWQVVP